MNMLAGLKRFTQSDYAAGALDGKLAIAGGIYGEGTKGRWIKKHFSASTHDFDLWVVKPPD
jgi:hypothetical protein